MQDFIVDITLDESMYSSVQNKDGSKIKIENHKILFSYTEEESGDEGKGNSLCYKLQIEKNDKINEASFSVCALDFVKEVYHPGKLRIVLKIDGWDLSVPDMEKFFSQSVVEFYFRGNPKRKMKYFVTQVLPEFYARVKSVSENDTSLSSAGSCYYVTIIANSPDVFLSLGENCQTFLAQKMGADILSDAHLNSYLPSWTGVGMNASRKLRHLETTYQKLSDDGKLEKTASEFIQPFLVQYNESFYDFIVRTLNRCGEFFFYENEHLYIGFPTANLMVNALIRPKSKSLSSDADTETVDVNVKQVDRAINVDVEKYRWLKTYSDNYAQQKKEERNLYNTGGVKQPYAPEFCDEEHLSPILAPGKYSQYDDHICKPGGIRFDSLNDMFSSGSISDAIDHFVFTELSALVRSGVLVGNAMSKYKKAYFKDEQTDDDDDYKNYHYVERWDRENDEVYPFSSANHQIGEGMALSNSFYVNVLRGVEEEERGKLRLTLVSCSCLIPLGALVKFNDSFLPKTYVVVKVEGQLLSPVGLPESEQRLDACVLEVIPYDEKAIYPSLAHVPFVRRSGAQRAYVVDTDDHSRMDRVRVRFSWENEALSTTPWIRTVEPVASNNMGFHFLPVKNDEAIVNFEYGNIERPYVEGWVYNADTTPICLGHKGAIARSLTSCNGHSVIFNDPGKGSDIIASFMPCMKTLNKFVPMFKLEGTTTMKMMTGGIELTDKMGIYSVKFSSDQRSITMNSPLGNIVFNAFSGITVNAPNGKVSIVGKNIDLDAGNNLAVLAGQNLTPYFADAKEKAKALLTKELKHLQILDMAFLRTLFETVIRPVGGTLKIHSNRNLCMESGGGKAQIIGHDQFVDRSIRKDIKMIWDLASLQKSIYSPTVFYLLERMNAFLKTLQQQQKKKQLLLANSIHSFQSNVLNPVAPMKTVDELLHQTQEGGKFKALKPEKKANAISKKNIKEYNTYAEALCDAAAAAQTNQVLDAEWKSLSGHYADGILYDYIKKNKSSLSEYCSLVAESLNVEVHFDRNELLKKQRMIMANYYDTIVSNVSEEDYLQFSKPTLPNENDLLHWEEWVENNVQTTLKEDSSLIKSKAVRLGVKTGRIITRKAISVFGLGGIHDRYVWDKANRGETLLSPRDGTTYHIANREFGALHEINSVRIIEKIRDLLLHVV